MTEAEDVPLFSKIPKAWTEEAEAAGKASFEVDGAWYHYEAVVDIARKAVAEQLRLLAAEFAIMPPANAIARILGRANEIEKAL